jgi:A/G-specific adenine glycosylase
VAEIMLQQTQVATVIPYYERFLARFPDLATLAAADEEDVTALWSGLGYYARARHLRRAARLVMERHGGRLPADRGALEALPGIGRYTAGAILSIGFGLEEPVVDGNVRRLLSRLLLTASPACGLSAASLADPSPSLQEAQARALLHGAPPADFNQALMELGALVCRPLSPLCPECPLARQCRARLLGIQEQVPPPRRRPPARREMRAVALVRSGRGVLLERAHGPGAPRGMWDLPGVLLPPGADARRHLERHLRERGLRVVVGAPLATVEHAITFRWIRSTAYEARLEGELAGEIAAPLSEGPVESRWGERGEARRGEAAGRRRRDAETTEPARRWAREDQLGGLPLGAAARRLLTAVINS